MACCGEYSDEYVCGDTVGVAVRDTVTLAEGDSALQLGVACSRRSMRDLSIEISDSRVTIR